MYTLIFYRLLIAQTTLGIVCAALLFVLCFSLVHLARLVKFGWKYQTEHQTKPSKEQTEQKPVQEPPKQEQKTPAPVYYIVERKRRSKTSYTEPKQIRFK